jgi:hypothetical protein
MWRKFLIVCLFACVVCGCGKRRHAPTSALVEDEKTYFVAVLLDMSGSFQHMMAVDGKAHQFLMQVLDRYFRDRMGSEDKIVISHISDGDRALLWQGTPTQLRRDFSSAASFRKFLQEKAEGGGSQVHNAIVQTADYVASDPSIVKGKAKSALLILSDMVDSGSDSKETRKKAVASLAEYGKTGGAIGMYYLDQNLTKAWREELKGAGIKNYCIEADFVGQPNLPTFE